MARHNSRRNFPPEYAEEFWIEDEFDDEYYDVGQQGDVWSPIEDNFKLYVGNVPMEMPQAKIDILFRRFGDPIEIYRCPNKPLSNMTWCLITYASYIEALQTIKGINQKPPYYLIVKFARTEEEKQHFKMKAVAQPYETPYLR
ncbi:unnamed protein product [Timema podura]|uniref:RRM domain-containing protein n=1 Tax=Timema podura TaxID=61482 RepID=A0ABN7NGR2_TIMPD|nr:unnamed protein product [Timema podura]